MKVRISYVTNSSSSSFVLVNCSNEKKTGEDWINELQESKLTEAIEELNEEEGYDEEGDKWSLDDFVKIAKKINLQPKSFEVWTCTHGYWDVDDDIVKIF